MGAAAALCAARGRVFVAVGSTLYVFDPATRAVARQVALPGSQVEISLGVHRDGTLYGLCSAGVYTVNPDSSEVKLIAQSPTPVSCGFALTDMGLYFGSGTHLWKFSEAVKAGEMTAEEFVEAEASMSRSPGSCNTMGTASTMTSAAEAMGLTLAGAASIPAAVMTVAVFSLLRTRGTILEANLSQTVASASTSLATGTIFTIPALFLWGAVPPYLQVVALAFLGAVLGIAAMVPLRRLLIVKAHDELPYPEGTACAEVLRATAHESGGTANASAWIFRGMAAGAVPGDAAPWSSCSRRDAISAGASAGFSLPPGAGSALARCGPTTFSSEETLRLESVPQAHDERPLRQAACSSF